MHLCFNCLNTSYDVRSCNSTYNCSSNLHQNVLYVDKSAHSSSQVRNNDPNSVNNSHLADQSLLLITCTSTSCLVGVENESTGVLLFTALVGICDSQGNFPTIRCLSDSESMTSFITQKADNKLSLPTNNFAVEIQGMNQMKLCFSKGKVTLSFRSPNQKGPILYTDAIILPKICDSLPQYKYSTDSWSHLINIILADHTFNSPGSIDVLLGADIFPKILLNVRISGNEGEPYALNTIFGYVLMEKIDVSTPSIS